MSVHRGSRHACRAPAQPVQMLKAHHKSALHMLGNADAFATDLAPIVDRLKSEGLTSLPQIARGLNLGGYETARGGKWHPSSVSNLLKRLSV